MNLSPKVKEHFQNYIMVHKWPYWISATIVGLIAVFYARIVVYSEHLAVYLTSHNPKIFIIITPTFFAASWAIVYYFSPESKGSGIPQVMAAVELVEKPDQTEKIKTLLGPRIIMAKILSSVFCLIGGGAIGREGPTLQVSASIFYFASQKFRFFKNYVKKEIWIVTGAAAGLAAAFNTPLGGLVYAIEELATTHLNKFKTHLIASVIIAGFSSQMISGPYLYLGYPKIKPLLISEFPILFIISSLCGLAGASFGFLIFTLTQKKNALFNTPKKLLSFSLIVGLLTALVIIFIDVRFMGSGKELILELLFSKGVVEWYVPLLRFIAPILTYLAGGAGGIFAPSLAAGASIGHFISGIVSSENSSLFTMIGMIAFLTGVTRAPFTAFILVLEMTDRHSAIIPMMISAVLAHNLSKIINPKSIYELLKENYVPEVKESDQ